MKNTNIMQTKQTNGNMTQTAAAARTVKSESFGIVLEINAGVLPSETRYALMQVFDLPTVFTRADFLKQLGVLTRSFAKGIIDPLNQFPVREFEYVALVDKFPAARRGTVLVETNQDDWTMICEAAGKGAQAAKNGAAKKLTRVLDKISEYKN